MKEPGYVYAGRLNAGELADAIQDLSPRAHFVWDRETFEAGEGCPGNLRDAGTAFNDRCEIRWQRTPDGGFLVWVLSDDLLPDALLPAVEERWETTSHVVCLFSRLEKRIDPCFRTYPVVDRPMAALRCRVFYRSSVPTFVSPREVMSDEESPAS